MDCVPEDTTIERGGALIVITGSEGVTNEIPSHAFADGWALRFERFLIALEPFHFREVRDPGPANLPCDSEYTRKTNQARLLDITRPIAIGVRGLSPRGCGFALQWLAWTTKDDVALGPGVMSNDLDPFYSVPRRFGPDEAAPSLLMEATARRGDATKRLRVIFGHKLACCEYQCRLNGRTEAIDVPSGGQAVVRLTLSGEQLFRTALGEDQGSLRFDAFAHADDDPSSGNQDGTITSDELEKVPLATLPPAYGSYELAEPGRHETLADVLGAQLRFVWRFEGGSCIPPGASSPPPRRD
jgi:hypothetical protein